MAAHQAYVTWERESRGNISITQPYIGEGIKWERESLNESKPMILQTVQWHHQDDSYEISGPKLVCGPLDSNWRKKTCFTLPSHRDL